MERNKDTKTENRREVQEVTALIVVGGRLGRRALFKGNRPDLLQS